MKDKIVKGENMKISKEKQKLIILKTIREIKSQRETFLCLALGNAIREILSVYHSYGFSAVRKYIPRFKRAVAIKYFNASAGYRWWDRGDRKNRLRFLKYLLDGKLPKTIKNKKEII